MNPNPAGLPASLQNMLTPVGQPKLPSAFNTFHILDPTTCEPPKKRAKKNSPPKPREELDWGVQGVIRKAELSKKQSHRKSSHDSPSEPSVQSDRFLPTSVQLMPAVQEGSGSETENEDSESVLKRKQHALTTPSQQPLGTQQPLIPVASTQQQLHAQAFLQAMMYMQHQKLFNSGLPMSLSQALVPPQQPNKLLAQSPTQPQPESQLQPQPQPQIQSPQSVLPSQSPTTKPLPGSHEAALKKCPKCKKRCILWCSSCNHAMCGACWEPTRCVTGICPVCSKKVTKFSLV